MANDGLARRFSPALFVLTLLSFATPSLAKPPTGPPPADPFLDPKNDPYNPLKYIASDILTAIAFSELLLIKVYRYRAPFYPTFQLWSSS